MKNRTGHPYALDVGKMTCTGPSPFHEGAWLLSWEALPGHAYPLTMMAKDDVPGRHYQAWIQSLVISRTITGEGHRARMTLDMPLLKIRIPKEDVPADPALIPDFILARMAATQKVDTPATRNGTPAELSQLLQDAADFLDIPIQLACAMSEATDPFLHAPGVATATRKALNLIVEHFHPVGTTYAGAEDWMDQRAQLMFGDYDPREPSGHDRIESAGRLTAFYTDRAREHGMTRSVLAAHLRAMGLGK